MADCAGYTTRRRAVLVQGPPPRQAEGRRVYNGAAATSSAAEKTQEFVEIEERLRLHAIVPCTVASELPLPCTSWS